MHLCLGADELSALGTRVTKQLQFRGCTIVCRSESFSSPGWPTCFFTVPLKTTKVKQRVLEGVKHQTPQKYEKAATLTISVPRNRRGRDMLRAIFQRTTKLRTMWAQVVGVIVGELNLFFSHCLREGILMVRVCSHGACGVDRSCPDSSRKGGMSEVVVFHLRLSFFFNDVMGDTSAVGANLARERLSRDSVEVELE